MSKESLPPKRLSNARPTPWWRNPANAAALLGAVAAFLLGGWVYQAQSPQAPSNANGQASDAAPDAVQLVLKAGKPTIVEFGANNCVSCREMKPVLHALALDPRIAVADVDILKERGYISKYQIRLMPTQVFYNAQGVEIGRHMGKISAEDILAQLGLTAAP
ncbi:thioredoxin family protein [Rhodoferax sp.]|jgi:thioredoxin 1|uniref:thioredoxin family protein n=1 Tax=Rhodoferax sp. TaxID=50421 RepID=UPI002717598E|nr:thioredoxin family protein [Rhodoferax sp.]MDO9144358.1 thioredoxin family protein [Rhodoferax sp.]MDP1531629.1 thioredoxin family protein [Rhodoferax sp.]MDP1944186.1 thioredoxin family protein [Rhodoferax sp.]MDP2441160.1 thioredoxin family protein [Rhodoferax sp.]MDP3192457.1 thioredoxin family protein [Rhodoferax sp.]